MQRKRFLSRQFTVRASKVWHIVTDYTKNSTIHGLRYLTERNRPIIEKLWWLIVFIASIVACFMLITQKMIERRQHPFEIGISDELKPVWEIPFPAITICPPFRYSPQRLNYSAARKSLYGFALKVPVNESWIGNNTRKVMSRLNTMFNFIHPNNAELFTYPIETEGKDHFYNLYKIAPNSKHLLISCKFQNNKNSDCKDFITEIITADGICLTFNLINMTQILRQTPILDHYQHLKEEELRDTETNRSRDIKHWSLNGGYSIKPLEYAYPLRVTADSSDEDFRLLLTLPSRYRRVDNDTMANTFKMVLHSPVDFPRIRKKYIPLHSNSDYNIMVKPEVVNTKNDLRVYYSPKERQCYFSDEGDLKFFKIYTQSNCELECMSKFIEDACNCVPVQMVRDTTTKVCNYLDVKCYHRAEREFDEKNFWRHTRDGELNDPLHCGCLKSCTDIEYDSYIFDKSDRKRNSRIKLKLSITLHKTEMKMYERKIKMDRKEFLSFIGGILGVFMGISILSFIEIFYYFTIRFMCNIGMRWGRKRRMKNLKIKRMKELELVNVTVKTAE